MDLTLCFLLIAIGFVFLRADLLIPTGGFLFAGGLAAIGLGLVFAFVYNPSVGLMVLVAVFIALPLMFMFLGHYWPRSAMGRRFVLTEGDADATVASLPVNQ